MLTKWRILQFSTILLLIGFLMLLIRIARKRGVFFSNRQAFFLIFGCTLTYHTLLVSRISNFNLGVILPAFFGLPMILLSFLLPLFEAGKLIWLKWMYRICYGTAGCIFLVCGICMLSAAHSVRNAKQADCLIVLGAAVHDDRVTWVLSNRLDTASEYLERFPDSKCIVTGGQGNGETVTEASAMAKYLREEKGIAGNRILLEEQAKSTLENFRFSKQILDKQFQEHASVAFVTTDFHVFRAGQVAKSQGIDAYGIAAPDVWYLRLNNFLRECVGICVYSLRGNFS